MAGRKKFLGFEPSQLEAARIAYTTRGPNKTAKDFDMSPNTFRRLAREQGWISERELLDCSRNHLTQDEIDEIIKREYPTKGRQLAFELNFSEEKIRRDAVRLGVYSEQGLVRLANEVTLVKDYFKHWSITMAYDLGYIWGDGSTGYVTGTTKPQNLHLKCKTADENIILGIRDRLGSNHKITRGVRLLDSGNLSYYTTVTISNSEITRTLIEDHGVLPGKSFKNLHFPKNIPDDLFCHFARGLFDADGSTGQYFYDYGDQNLAYFLGSPTFIYEFHSQLIKVYPVLTGKLPEINPHGLGQLSYRSKRDISNLYDFLYPENEDFPFLGRKREIMKKIKDSALIINY